MAAPWTARRTDCARAKARARTVGDEVVHRGADDRHIRAVQVCGVLRVGDTAKAQQSGEVWFFSVRSPAFERIDHVAIVSTPEGIIAAFGRRTAATRPGRP